ncbi:MAG TPA: arginine--tRNA ligase [Candidatus Binataceae bacterium]|nr:arginine--tRNA ligase [Candidatus Binataceae bacterium]
MRDLLVSILSAAIERARAAGKLKSAASQITIEAPHDPSHGDAASNVALTMARAEGKAPRAIAAIIREHMQLAPEIQEAAVAGPGFINFRMAPAYWHSEMRRAAREGAGFFRPLRWELRPGAGKRVQVEFLSANPTGPLTVGHGRNAVLGDTIARLFESAGFDVTREFYFNDGGRQMKLLGESVRVRYLEELGRPAAMPEEAYQGEYIREIARGLRAAHGDGLADSPGLDVFRSAAVRAIFADINHTCERLGIRFDVYTNEIDLIRSGKVDEVLSALRARDLLVEKEGAIWLRGEPIGLPKDEVLVRSGPDAEPTYRTPDIAYHIDKLRRGFDLVIDVFGADHIAEHQQVVAAVRALGHDTSAIHAIIYQFVTLTRGGEKVKMSTRKATYVTLDELIDEVGADVVRFFFLFRKSDSHLDFDLELAKRQAPENPVFYVQYAHARLASVFREAEKAGLTLPADEASINLEMLGAEEVELAKRAVGLPAVMTAAAQALEPHRIPFYLLELAGDFHRYYNKPTNRIIGTDRDLSVARLFLAGLLKTAIAAGLGLLGVSAPDRM